MQRIPRPSALYDNHSHPPMAFHSEKWHRDEEAMPLNILKPHSGEKSNKCSQCDLKPLSGMQFERTSAKSTQKGYGDIHSIRVCTFLDQLYFSSLSVIFPKRGNGILWPPSTSDLLVHCCTMSLCYLVGQLTSDLLIHSWQFPFNFVIQKART